MGDKPRLDHHRIRRAADGMISNHGKGALAEAYRRAQTLISAGCHSSAADWERICELIQVSFPQRPRSHTAMDAELENIIRRALADARTAGRDYLTQTEEAVRAGHEARPDLTASDVLAQVRRLQQS